MQPTLLTNAARAVCTWLSVRQVGRGSFDFVSHIQTERGLHLFFRRQRSIPLSPEAYLTQVRHRRHICTAAEWTEIRGGEVGGWGWGILSRSDMEMWEDVLKQKNRWNRAVTDRGCWEDGDCRGRKWDIGRKRESEKETVLVLDNKMYFISWSTQVYIDASHNQQSPVISSNSLNEKVFSCINNLDI